MKKFSRQSLWTGATPAFVGALVLLQLFAVGALASVADSRVYVLGREVAWGCLFKRAFGLPCPICGMTRSVVLTLDGNINAALALNPAGPLLVAGLALLGASLILLPFHRRTTRDPRAAGLLHARLRLGARAYSGLLFAVLFAHWVVELFAR